MPGTRPCYRMAYPAVLAPARDAVDEQQGLAFLFGLVLFALGVVDLAGLLVTDGLLLGVFEISIGFSVVHVLTGLLGIVLATFAGAGTLFNKLGSVIYLVAFLATVVAILAGSQLVNWALAGLHLGLALLTGLVGFGIGDPRPR